MTNKRIIIVEDEKKIADILTDYLEQDGFEVTTLGDGGKAIEQIPSIKPIFIILDLMLPNKDGLSICREVRQFSTVPILMLTARVDEIDRLLGLEMGADDYVCKPFLPREIVARVHAILRRIKPVSTNEQPNMEYQSIHLPLDRFQCQIDNKLVELTPVEFRILQKLMNQPGRVYSRNDLMKSSYLDNRVVSDRTIDSHIKNLRKKLSTAMGGKDIIHSIYGVGYKIE